MARRRRYLLLNEFRASRLEGFLTEWEAKYAACPDAARFTDQEAEDFVMAALFVDYNELAESRKALQRARIPCPPDCAFDPYRLGRYLFRRWDEPAIRTAFITRGQCTRYNHLNHVLRTGDMRSLQGAVASWSLPLLAATLRYQGAGQLIERLLPGLTPQQVERSKGLLLCAKVTMHRFLTEPAPTRQPSRLEQRALSRRLHLREVQLRSMRRSQYRLRRERKALMGRLREASRLINQPELDALAAQLTGLRAERAQLERDFAAALADQQTRCEAMIARLQAEVAAARRDFSEALALRRSWLPLSREGAS